MFPPMTNPVPGKNICMIGLRSVDPAEREALARTDIHLADMRHIDEYGIKAPLADFLARVDAADGLLHVSLDVDFLDPAVAPAVGTTSPGDGFSRLAVFLYGEPGRSGRYDALARSPAVDVPRAVDALLVRV